MLDGHGLNVSNPYKLDKSDMCLVRVNVGLKLVCMEGDCSICGSTFPFKSAHLQSTSYGV